MLAAQEECFESLLIYRLSTFHCLTTTGFHRPQVCGVNEWLNGDDG